MGYEKEAIRELEAKAKKILSLKDEAEEIIEELEEHKFSEDIKKRVYKPALTHRPTYVRGLREVLSGLTQPEDSMDGLKRFHTNLTNTLMAVQKIQHSQGRYLALVFRELLLNLGGVLNRIIDLNEEYKAVLKEFGDNTQGIEEVLNGADAIEGSLKNLKSLAVEIATIEDSLEELDERYVELTAELEKLIRSPRYKRLIKVKETLEQQRRRRQEVESQILNRLRPKARVFRKFKRYLEGKGNKDAFLEKYLDDPVDTFLKEELGCPRLRRITRSIEQARQEGGISLSGKEERIIRVDWQFLDRLKEAAIESEATADLDDSPEKERERLDREMLQTKGKKESLAQSLADKKVEIESLKESITEGGTKLEEELRGIRKGDYSIEIPLNLE
ncbi:MAG: hypothetical protein ACE5G7_00700 [Candidatus Hydrothermarchaeaceae archaeon]